MLHPTPSACKSSLYSTAAITRKPRCLSFLLKLRCPYDIFIHIEWSSKLSDLLRRLLLCASWETGGSDGLLSSVGRADRPGSAMQVVRQLLSVEEWWRTWNIRSLLVHRAHFPSRAPALFCLMIWPAIQPLPLHVLNTTLMVLPCVHTLIPLTSRHSCTSPLVSPTQFIPGSSDLLSFSFKTLFIWHEERIFHTGWRNGESCVVVLCVYVYFIVIFIVIFIFIYSPRHALPKNHLDTIA